MITDSYKHQLNDFLGKKATDLLAHQSRIFARTYTRRTGTLAEALLNGQPEVTDMKVSIPYPKHIRFLDMKKTRLGKRKKRYAQIYNRYVYGYLKSSVYKLLMGSLPDQIVKTIEDNITTLREHK